MHPSTLQVKHDASENCLDGVEGIESILAPHVEAAMHGSQDVFGVDDRTTTVELRVHRDGHQEREFACSFISSDYYHYYH
jgi:hypothetical protein